MRKFIFTVAAALLFMDSPAMTRAEYQQFRNLIKKAEAQIDKTESALDHLETIAANYDAVIENVGANLRRYEPTRWWEADEKLKYARGQIGGPMARCKEWHDLIVRKCTQIVLRSADMGILVSDGYNLYSKADIDASRFLAAIWSIPGMVTQEEWIYVYGQYTSINFNPRDYGLPEPIEINFTCACSYHDHDAEYQLMKDELPFYEKMLDSLTGEFSNIQHSAEVPE